MNNRFISIMDHAINKLDSGRFRSGIAEMQEAFLAGQNPESRILGAYNVATAYWATLGNGENAVNYYRKLVEEAEKTGVSNLTGDSIAMLGNSYENLMHLSLSYQEYFEWAEKLRAVQPQDDILRGMVPNIKKEQEGGFPWSQILEGLAHLCYNRSDPSKDRGEYARAVSTYMIILRNRKALRLDREAWGRITYEFGTLSLRMASDAMVKMDRAKIPPDPEEYIFLVQDAKVFVDDSHSANPAEPIVKTLVENMEGFLAAEEEALQKNRVAILVFQGREAMQTRDFQTALLKFQEGEKICLENGDQNKLQTCIGNIASVAFFNGDPQTALDLYLQKEQICRQIGFNEGLANALSNQALTLEMLNREPEALAAAQEAYQLSKKIGMSEFAAEVKPVLDRLQTNRNRSNSSTTTQSGYFTSDVTSNMNYLNTGRSTRNQSCLARLFSIFGLSLILYAGTSVLSKIFLLNLFSDPQKITVTVLCILVGSSLLSFLLQRNLSKAGSN